MTLRHHLIFDGAVMAQTALRHHQSVPKEKRDGGRTAPSLFPNGAPMAQWRKEQSPSPRRSGSLWLSCNIRVGTYAKQPHMLITSNPPGET
jgi:hypothetical protein